MRTSILAVCLILTALCCGAAAKEIDKDFHETFDVGQGTTLRLDHGDGDATIIPWDQDVIDVKVRYHADVTAVGFGVDPDFEVEFRTSDDLVVVRGIETSSSGVYMFHSTREHEYTYTIHAPSYIVLDLIGDDGDVDVEGWRATIDCSLDDGDIRLSDVVNDRTEISIEDGDARIDRMEGDFFLRGDDGNVSITDSRLPLARIDGEDGDIRVVDSEANLEISMDDGDMTVARVTAQMIDIRCNDGDVDLDLVGSGEIHINVSSDDGDVILRLAPELVFEYLVTVDDGDVDIDLDGAHDTDTSEHRYGGRVGDGGGLVRVSTADGDVDLITGG